MKKLLLLMLLVTASAFAAYDASKPADDGDVASGPEEIRENMRALKEDGIVNAGTLASYTYAQIVGAAAGTALSCIASTTSAEMITSGNGRFTSGTATGAALIYAWFSATATQSQNFESAQFRFWIPMKIATTTELSFIRKCQDYESATSTMWNVSIATSANRGELVFTASGPVGARWEGNVTKVDSQP